MNMQDSSETNLLRHIHPLTSAFAFIPEKKTLGKIRSHCLDFALVRSSLKANCTTLLIRCCHDKAVSCLRLAEGIGTTNSRRPRMQADYLIETRGRLNPEGRP